MHAPTPPHAVIFDFDGTLADTFPLVIRAWNAAIEIATGGTQTPEEVISRFGVPEPEMFRREFAEHGEAVWRKALDDYHAAYEAHHAMVEPFAGVSEMLLRLREAGIPMGVMTSKGRKACDISLCGLGWNALFASVVTGDEVAEQKPSPEGPLRVAQQMGAPPARCVFVGDSPADIEAGRAAGMSTVAAAWHTVYTDALRAAEPDHWIESPEELVTVLGLSRGA